MKVCDAPCYLRLTLLKFPGFYEVFVILLWILSTLRVSISCIRLGFDCSELFPSYFWALKNNKAPRYSFISIWSFFLTLMACLTYAKIDDNSLWLKSDATEYESSPTAVRNIYFTAIGIGFHKIFSLETRSWFQGIIKTGFFFLHYNLCQDSKNSDYYMKNYVVSSVK